MVYGVVEENGRVLISMAGRVRPNEHLWARRALGQSLGQPGLSVVCDLTEVPQLGEAELILLGMIRRWVELRGGRVELWAPDEALRRRLGQFGFGDLVATGDTAVA